MKLLSIFIFTLFSFRANVARVERWVIDKSSSLCILGKTNINNFRCDIVEYINQDTLTFYKGENSGQLTTVKGGLTIDINRFDCHQKHITTDFRKTLKADADGFMRIRFLTLKDLKTTDGYHVINGSVEIELAGIRKIVDIYFSANSPQAGRLYLVGKRQLAFSDFNLVPPRKLAGMIKVEQEINVEFRLALR
jgi:hypothetical protein